MTQFLLFILALLGVTIIIWGTWRQERMIQFPFLAAAVFLGWMFPQLLGLTNNPWLPSGALEKTIFMAILCLAAAWLGYVTNRRSATLFTWVYDTDRLLWGAIALMVLGGFFFYQVTLLAPDAGTRWTGIITIYVFFAKMLTFGFALALILYLNKATWLGLFAVLFGLLFYMDRILIHGRRAAMVELGLMVLLAIWFNRRWRPSRMLMIVSLVLGTLVINSIGEYRRVMLGDTYMAGTYGWSGAGITDILRIDFLGNLRDIGQGRGVNHSLMNAAMNIEAADRTLRFDYGLSHWNGFIRQYVPGQWVGHDRKEALMIQVGNDPYGLFGHTPHTGTTQTGLSDAFQSFWYFGAIKFFIIGLILSRWYRAALQGHLVGQLVILLTITPALHAITHSTHSFFVMFLQLAVFMLPALWFARVRVQRRVYVPQRAKNRMGAVKAGLP